MGQIWNVSNLNSKTSKNATYQVLPRDLESWLMAGKYASNTIFPFIFLFYFFSFQRPILKFRRFIEITDTFNGIKSLFYFVRRRMRKKEKPREITFSFGKRIFLHARKILPLPPFP